MWIAKMTEFLTEDDDVEVRDCMPPTTAQPCSVRSDDTVSDEQQQYQDTGDGTYPDDHDELEKLSEDIANMLGRAKQFGSRLLDAANNHVFHGKVSEVLAPTKKLSPKPNHRFIVGVMGSSSNEHTELADPLGRWIAAKGWHLLTGGGQGVMTSVARGFVSVPGRKGCSIGILPRADDDYHPRPGYPNEFVEIPIATHLPRVPGHSEKSRNHINVLSSDVVIALPGSDGTASEVEHAIRYGKPVAVYLGSSEHTIGHLDLDTVPVLRTLEQVAAFVESALAAPITRQPPGLGSESIHGDSLALLEAVGETIDGLSPVEKKQLQSQLTQAAADVDEPASQNKRGHTLASRRNDSFEIIDKADIFN